MPTDLEHYTSASAICSTYNHTNGGEHRCLTEHKGCAWMRLINVTKWNPHGAGQCVADKWCNAFTLNNMYYECLKGHQKDKTEEVSNNSHIPTSHAGMRA